MPLDHASTPREYLSSRTMAKSTAI